MALALLDDDVPTVLNGIIGGLVAGLATAVVAVVRGSGPSTTARSLADRFDGDPAAYRRVALVVHLAYGAAAGGLLVALELYVLDVLAVPVAFGTAMGLAVGWTLILGVSAVGFWAATGADLRRERVVGVLGSHLALGVVLGLWMYATWTT